MNSAEMYRSFARYNRWMNQKLYALAAKLPEEKRKADRGAFFRSIHGTLNHLLLADHIWMFRFTGDVERFRLRDARGEPIAPKGLDFEAYDEFADLQAKREWMDGEILGWVGGLREEDLAGTLSYRTFTTQANVQIPLWWGLSHLFNHQTHHRGQVTTLFSQLGIDPGLTDFAMFLIDHDEGEQ